MCSSLKMTTKLTIPTIEQRLSREAFATVCFGTEANYISASHLVSYGREGGGRGTAIDVIPR